MSSHVVQCAECEEYYCQRCDIDEITSCVDCGKDFCNDCADSCHNCGDSVCDECKEYCDECEESFCSACWQDHSHEDVCEPSYCKTGVPYQYQDSAFYFGVEIEVDGEHDRDPLKNSLLIAGWCPDQSLDCEGLEYQTHPMRADSDTLRQLVELIRRIPDNGGNAGGHVHVQRTPRQTASRWYWALSALSEQEASDLNMRHASDYRYWCHLEHGEYSGKHTAINDSHEYTIELRTFGAWNENSALLLEPAVRWLHTIWRLFEQYPVGKLKTRDIQACARTAYYASFPTAPTRTQRYLARNQH